VLGFLAVKTANIRHVLVVNMGAPETGISLAKGKDNPEIDSIVVENGVVGNSIWTYKNPIPCNQRIHPLLYALDVFVPVLDLHQQTVYSVDPVRTPWRYAQAGYAILGWC
jgi:hypothetical protein